MDERFIEEMRDMHNGMLRKAHIIDEGFWSLNNIPQEHTYGNTSYKKGGTVVNTLRNYLGDTLFFNSIKTYLQHFAYQSVSSYDLRDFLSGITGIDMNNFFEGWVFRLILVTNSFFKPSSCKGNSSDEESTSIRVLPNSYER